MDAATPTVTAQPDAADEAGGTAQRAGAPVAPAGTAGATAGGGAPSEAMPDVGPVPGRQAEAAPSPGAGQQAKDVAETQGAAGQPDPQGPTRETPTTPPAGAGSPDAESDAGSRGAEPDAGAPGTESSSSTETPTSTRAEPAPEGGAARADVDQTGSLASDSTAQADAARPAPEEVARLQETPGPNVEVPHEEPQPATLERTEDPEEAYRLVLAEQQAKGSSPQVAEARAKVARVKAERGIRRSSAQPDATEGKDS